MSKVHSSLGPVKTSTVIVRHRLSLYIPNMYKQILYLPQREKHERSEIDMGLEQFHWSELVNTWTGWWNVRVNHHVNLCITVISVSVHTNHSLCSDLSSNFYSLIFFFSFNVPFSSLVIFVLFLFAHWPSSVSVVMDNLCSFSLSSDLFQKLFRQDLLVASLFRNFLLAERIMRSYNCTPVSSPRLPPTYMHAMW